LEGVIAPKANLMMQVCGGISAQATIAQLDSMAADQRTRSAVLAIDSPGGSVTMIPAVAAAVRRLADAKPTVSVSQGTMASALYWIGAASNAVFISGETDMVGSIGVVATHNYQPRATGQVTTEITAGKYKRMASSTGPLTQEGQDYLQAQVDEIYRVFVGAVASSRGVSADQVHQQMADGRIFVGQQALDRGLADGIATVDQMAERLATNPSEFAARRKAVFAVGKPKSHSAAGVAAQGGTPTDAPVLHVDSQPANKDSSMDPKEQAAAFAAEHPEAAALLRAEGSTQEQARVAAVRAQTVPGFEALVNQLAADGKTTGPEAAVAVLSAVRAANTTAAADHAADAPNAAPTSSAPDGEAQELTKVQQVAKAKAHAAQHGLDFVAAMKALGFAA
jgi:capsid assembly protease